MPQLDPTSFPSQLFWLTVSFVMLYVLMARVFLPKVQSVLAHRAHTIEGDIQQAERMKSEAERAEEQYEKALAEARAKSQAMFAAAQAEIAEHAAKRQAELADAIEIKLAESDATIRAAKQAVQDKLKPVASDLASLIVEVVVHQKPNQKDVGDAIDVLAKRRA